MNSNMTLGFNDANIYHKYHEIQEQNIKITLTQYLPKLQLNKISKILDIGCGPGDSTYKYLLPLIPENGAVIGIDKSQNMIQYANSFYKEDSRLSFEVMDILNPLIVEKYKNTFEMIFSFFCFHWIQDQKSAMEYVYKILKHGGELVMVFIATWPVYNMYEILASSPRWYPYVKDYKNFISPYHQIADPVRKVRNLMEEIGFQIKNCVHTPSIYTIPSKEIFYQWMEGLNPFVSNIPGHLRQDYLEDCKAITWRENFCSLKPTKEVNVYYTTITVHASKL